MSVRPRLTSDEYQAHLVNPGTALDRQYMKDFAASIRGDWARGANWSDEAKFKVEILEALAEMDLESIETFYEARDADEQDSQREPESDAGRGKSGY